MAFAAPRRWRTPGPGQPTDAWVLERLPHDDYFNAVDAAAVADMERQVAALRLEELASARRDLRLAHSRPVHSATMYGNPPHSSPTHQWPLQSAGGRHNMQPFEAPPSRSRRRPGWNSSTHMHSFSFPSQVAAADVTDRLRKESFKMGLSLSAFDALNSHQREQDHRLSRPKHDWGARHTRVPRKRRRWSDPQIKIYPPTIDDAHYRSWIAQQDQNGAPPRSAAQVRRFREWEQRVGEGRGLAGRQALGDWRTIRGKEERLRALQDATGAEAALEHGLHGAFGGYEHHCLNDAEAMHMLREKLARERTRALELEAQLWEERQREWELEKAIEHSVHAAYEKTANGGWGIPGYPCVGIRYGSAR